MTTDDQLYEEETVAFQAGEPRSYRALSKTLRLNGFALEDDIFLVRRHEKSFPPWQHDAYVEVEIFRNGREVFGDNESWDTVNISYPLARVPESGIALYVDKVSKLASTLDLPIWYGGKIVTPGELRAKLDAAAAKLSETIGPPGSENVGLEIEARYPRRR